MKNRFIRYVLIVLLCGLCHTAAFAYGYGKNAQSDSWGYQPLNSVATTLPVYQFRTTSSYLSPVGEYRSGNPMMRDESSGFSWGEDDPEDNPLGEVNDPTVPIGDAPWYLILLFAAGYIIYKKCSRKSTFLWKFPTDLTDLTDFSCIIQKKVVPLPPQRYETT